MTVLFHLAFLGRRALQTGDVIEFVDGLPPPTEEELDASREAAQAAWDTQHASRKVWQTVAEFWGEFSAEEQLAIMDHAHSGIRLLLEALRMWRGEVWGDDERVTQGLGALVALGVITEQRREDILAG